MTQRGPGQFPDATRVPDLPNFYEATAEEIVETSLACLRAVEKSIDWLEQGVRSADGLLILPTIRSIILECRRSTFVLQNLRGKVDGWENWYAPFQQRMGSDPLLSYFRDLRNEVEKDVFNGVLVELLDIDTQDVLSDILFRENSLGVLLTGASRINENGEHALREYSDPNGYVDMERILLGNFRLPDPPTEHQGQELTDFRFCSLARLARAYLFHEVAQPAKDHIQAS